MHKRYARKNKLASKNQTRDRGQGIVEYVLLIALVGVAVVAIVSVMEPAIGDVFSRLVQKNAVAPPSLAGYTPPPTFTFTPTIDPFPSSTPSTTPTSTQTLTPTPTATDPNAPTATDTPTASSTPTSTSTPGPICSPTGTQMAQINFQRAGNPIPSGYDEDTGAVFGDRGNGFIYGWNILNDLGRDRDNPISPDQRYDTLTHMQQNNNYIWEFDVPNGIYEACVVVGDANNIDSVYRLNVEGSLAVNFVPTSEIRWGGGFVQVHVVDGRITISNASGSANNKINFVHLYQVSVDPTSTPTEIPLETSTPTQTPTPTASSTPTPTPTDTPVPTSIIYVSSNSGGTAGGVGFNDEDIMRYDEGSDTWSRYIDLSDVGITNDLRAFTILGDGSILMSFTAAINVPGVGTVDDSDIVRFVPTTTGPTTSGTFNFYFDGSDVGLSTNGEDIDAIAVLADGRIVISTDADYNVGTVSGADEDLIAFTPTQLGANTSGSWAMYFDGSDISGLGGEDLNAAWIDPATGDVYQSVRGNFSVGGLTGDAADIFACTSVTTGTNTSCTYQSSLFWDGSIHGFGGELLDGMFIDLP